ncbi:MAG: Cof-type HAD-IIB family hydrolase [Peptoniphilaceae bacterium]|nr:Cof-type HAD-IIB family hydrolase [Peptoniphilaceae bacterium]MDY6018286.1 Cof-type HAD-IIB family hydrolase [Anaerococcus sp.]
MIKLIAIDVDGTLLDSNRRLPYENIKAIKEINKDKVKVVIATGRPYSGIEAFLRKLDLFSDDQYCITNTGAFVMKNESKESIITNNLNIKDYKYLESLLKGYDLQLTIYTSNEIYNYSAKPNAASLYDSKILLMKIKIPNKNFNSPIGRINVMGKKAEIDKFQNKYYKILSENYYLMRNETFSLEILNKNCGKGKALKKLCEYIGIKRNETMAIGDKENDIEMLSFAGIGIAMGNASQRVKESANFITKNNDNYGLAFSIKNMKNFL